MKSGSPSAQTMVNSFSSKRFRSFALAQKLFSLSTIATLSLTSAHAEELPEATQSLDSIESTSSQLKGPLSNTREKAKQTQNAQPVSRVQQEKETLVKPTDVNAESPENDARLTPNALQLAEMLKIVETMEELRTKSANKSQSRDDIIDIIILKDKLSRAIQYAALELEEALANIDGELAIANMQYSYFSAKHDRAVALNNIATFTASGGLGVLDSSTGIKYGAPLPNIFGITGNALAVGIPLLGLIPPKYKVDTHNQHHPEHQGNMLAPIFGRTEPGSGYDPIVWKYLKAVPADSKTNQSRIQTLLKSWESYRHLASKDSKSKQTLDVLTSMAPKDKKIGLDLIKTKSELLVELRAQVQQMYKDISDLNTSIMAIN